MPHLHTADGLRHSRDSRQRENGCHLQVVKLCQSAAAEFNEPVELIRWGERMPRAEDGTRVRLALEVAGNQRRRGDGQLSRAAFDGIEVARPLG
ncbi:hypothetical protein GCM10009605_17950 [Nocardiopsis composta]